MSSSNARTPGFLYIYMQDQLAADHPHNNRFRGVTPAVKRQRNNRDQTPSPEESLLVIGSDAFSSTYGIVFGSDPNVCDVWIGAQQRTISRRHFCLTFDFSHTEPKPETMLLRNLSTPLGTRVGMKKLSGRQAVDIPSNKRIDIVAGSAAFYIEFYADGVSKDDWRRFCRLDEYPPDLRGISLPHSLNNTPTFIEPKAVLPLIEKYEDVPAKAGILPWNSGNDYEFKDVLVVRGSYCVRSLRRVADDRLFTVKLTVNGPISTDRWVNERDLERELRILRGLMHKNVARLHDFCSWEGARILVTEYLPLGSIQERLDRKREPFNEDLARSAIVDVLRGLEYLHGMGISHGDLSASNIMIRHEDPLTCVITDFGKACDFPVSSAWRGTQPFVAPEVAKSAFNDSDYATLPADIWSVGVLLYYLTTGSLPPICSREKELYTCLVRWRPDLESLSDDCRHLLTRIFALVASSRPTAKRCLAESWCRTDTGNLLQAGKISGTHHCSACDGQDVPSERTKVPRPGTDTTVDGFDHTVDGSTSHVRRPPSQNIDIDGQPDISLATARCFDRMAQSEDDTFHYFHTHGTVVLVRKVDGLIDLKPVLEVGKLSSEQIDKITKILIKSSKAPARVVRRKEKGTAWVSYGILRGCCDKLQLSTCLRQLLDQARNYSSSTSSCMPDGLAAWLVSYDQLDFRGKHIFIRAQARLFNATHIALATGVSKNRLHNRAFVGQTHSTGLGVARGTYVDAQTAVWICHKFNAPELGEEIERRDEQLALGPDCSLEPLSTPRLTYADDFFPEASEDGLFLSDMQDEQWHGNLDWSRTDMIV